MLVHPQIDPVALSLGPVQIHWYGLTYLVAFGLFLWLAAQARAPAVVRRSRLDAARRRRHAVLRRARRGHRRAAGLLLFYKPDYYAAQSARDLCGLERRHDLSWRHARCDVRDGAVRAHAQAAVPAGHRPDRAVCAGRAGGGAHRQLHQRRVVGPCGRSRRCRGRWCSRNRARRCRAIRRSCTSSRSKACCCSRCCGCTRGKPRPTGQVSGMFLIGYGVSALHRRVLPRARQLPRPAAR